MPLPQILFKLFCRSSKNNLKKENESLKAHIQFLENQDKLEELWIAAFSQGFSKAWDIAWDVQVSGFEKAKEKLKSQTINETLGRLNGNKP